MRRTEIYRALREEILSTRLPPGAELREQELARQFDVSKSPVREALQELLRDGLVVVLPRQGYRVSPVSLSDAHELFALRRELELACVAEAIRNGSDEQLATLEPFRRYDSASDDFIRYNRAFHCALAACSGNGRMTRMTCDVIEEMDRLIRLSVAAIRGRDPHKLVEEHRDIIDAVQQRNPKQAIALLRSHTTAAERRISEALEWSAVQA